MKNQKFAIGKTFETKEGYKVKIIGNSDKDRYRKIKFLDKFGYEYEANTSNIAKGSLSNPYHKTVLNVGYFGVGKYKSSINGKKTKEHSLWCSMMNRCYNHLFQKENPTYKDCLVDERWHNFQNFAEDINNIDFWNEVDKYNKPYQLDKDILNIGNKKIYSKNTVLFIPQKLNGFIANKKVKQKFPTGICFDKNNNKYMVQICINSKNQYLGLFKTLEEAEYVYKKNRYKYAKELAEEFKGKVDDRVIKYLISHCEEVIVTKKVS